MMRRGNGSVIVARIICVQTTRRYPGISWISLFPECGHMKTYSLFLIHSSFTNNLSDRGNTSKRTIIFFLLIVKQIKNRILACRYSDRIYWSNLISCSFFTHSIIGEKWRNFFLTFSAVFPWHSAHNLKSPVIANKSRDEISYPPLRLRENSYTSSSSSSLLSQGSRLVDIPRVY